MNRSELIAEVLTESHRSDLQSTQIGAFLTRAEAMITRNLRAAEMMHEATLTDADRLDPDHVYTLPERWLEDISVNIDRRVLEKISVSSLVSQNLKRDPVFYSVLDKGRMEIRGRPRDETEIRLMYFERPQALINDEDTNLILSRHPEIYLEAILFLLFKNTQDLELARRALETWTAAVETLNELAGRYMGGTVKITTTHNAMIRSNGGY